MEYKLDGQGVVLIDRKLGENSEEDDLSLASNYTTIKLPKRHIITKDQVNNINFQTHITVNNDPETPSPANLF